MSTMNLVALLAVLSLAELSVIVALAVALYRKSRPASLVASGQTAEEESTGQKVDRQPATFIMKLNEMEQTVENQRATFTANDSAFLNRFRDFVLENMGKGRVEVEMLADKMCLSRSQLNRRVNALTGMSTSNFSIQLRLQKACQMLIRERDLSVSVVALRCGFDDAGYFARIFKRKIGQTPSDFRKARKEGNPVQNDGKIGLIAQLSSN